MLLNKERKKISKRKQISHMNLKGTRLTKKKQKQKKNKKQTKKRQNNKVSFRFMVPIATLNNISVIPLW